MWATDWAESGAMWLTGRPAGPPLLPPGCAATTARELGEELVRLSSLAGRRVEVEGHRLLGERAAAAGLRRQGPRSPGGTFRLLAAADGPVGLALARPADVELVPALIEQSPDGDPWAAVAEWAAGIDAETAVARARLLGLPACVPSSFSAPVLPARSRQPARERWRDLLVVDLSSLWAGPLCAHLLGLAGARVVKVESWDRPDGARRGPADFYRLLHGDHECVALDFGRPADRARLLGLVEAADVVIESSRPRALRQLGIAAEDVVARAADKVWVSITAYGRTGPGADRVGYGDDTAVAAGLVAVDRAADVVVPVGDAIADPLTGLHAAVAALSATLAGGAHLLDIPLAAVVATTLPPGSTAPPTSPPGLVPERPVVREPRGEAREVGADTERVLEELGL